MQRRIRRILLAITLLLGLLAVLLAARYLSYRAQVTAQALTQARAEARAAVETINGALLRAQATAEGIGADLAAGRLAYADAAARLRAELEADPGLDGLAVTCEPFACDPGQRLTQIYAFRESARRIDLLQGATYDYTLSPGNSPGDPQTAWYYFPLREGAQWGEPFLATGAAKVLIEYGTPFARTDPADPRPAGVVTADFSLAGMRSLIAELNLGSRGYGFITSASGVFLAHPDPQFVAASSLFDPASGYGGAIRDVARQALAGAQAELEYTDALTGRRSWFFLAPLSANGGLLAVVVDAADLEPPPGVTLRNLMSLSLVLGAIVVLLTALVTRVERGDSWRLWALSISFSLICVALIATAWGLSARTRDRDGTVVTDNTAVERVLELYRARLDEQDQPAVVPTGIEITALQFPDPTAVTVNAVIWQRYAADLPADLARGFVLPQTIGELLPIEEVTTVRDGDAEILIWRVGIVLQQRFDPVRFPFDTRAIEIQLLPAELERNVVLVPDLDAYPLVRPTSLPGVAPGITLNNWELERSSFVLREQRDSSNLGIARRGDRAPAPQLYFTIALQRSVVGPFIAYLLPGLVTLALVFAFLMSDRQLSDQQDLVSALSYAAALFFVIAVAHTALRDSVAAIGITYLEHLYILLYVMVVAVIIDVFLLVRAPWFFLIAFGEHLLPKMLYWPACALALLVSTLALFVYGP